MSAKTQAQINPLRVPLLADVVATFETNADEAVVASCRQLVAAGRAVWVWDPEVETTTGLVLADNRRRAVVVVYDLGADFELDFELLEQVR